jgi:hypothetical protein
MRASPALGLTVTTPFTATVGAADRTLQFSILALSYMAIYLGLGRLILAGIRYTAQVGLLTRLLVHGLLLIAGTGIPVTIQSSSVALRSAGYTMLQVTNPFWTLVEALGRSVPWQVTALAYWLPIPALLVFLANLPGIAAEVRQVRISKPRRVAEEDAERAPIQPVAASPWD